MPAELGALRRIGTRPEVLDTSILVPFLSRGQFARESRAAASARRSWLSSLVALELYMGTSDQAEKQLLDRYVRSFEGAGRLLTPTHDDHVLGGLLLNRRRRLVGSLEARHHAVDLLIVLSASQIGATVVTQNVGHLAVWAAMARRAGRDVRVRTPLE